MYIAFFTFKNYLELKLKTTEVANFKLFFFQYIFKSLYTNLLQDQSSLCVLSLFQITQHEYIQGIQFLL